MWFNCPIAWWEGDTLIHKLNINVSFVSSRYNNFGSRVRGDRYHSCVAGERLLRDHPESQFRCEVPHSLLLDEPVASQKKLVYLFGHKLMTFDCERDHCVTENFEVRFIGCEKSILRGGQSCIGHQVISYDRTLAAAVKKTMNRFTVKLNSNIDFRWQQTRARNGLDISLLLRLILMLRTVLAPMT